MKEPEFKQHITDTTAPISGRNLRDQYDKIISDQCELHGWEENGGTTGNLSGGEGDLDELGRNVRQILMDKEKKRAKKEAEEANKLDLENKERDLLNGETVRTVQAARNKRKSPAPDLSSGGSKSTSSSDNSPWQAIDDLIFGRRQLTPKPAESDGDGHKRSFNPDRAAIDNFFRRRTMHEVARELKIRREDFPDDLEEMEECTIREQFVAAKWYYPTWEKAMLGFGLKQLETYKLFQILAKACDEFEEAKAAVQASTN
jgi:translation elongation factor EF-1beta